jgi:hypothetical protein
MFKNKGAGERDLRLLRAQQLVRRRVLVMATRIEIEGWSIKKISEKVRISLRLRLQTTQGRLSTQR